MRTQFKKVFPCRPTLDVHTLSTKQPRLHLFALEVGVYRFNAKAQPEVIIFALDDSEHSYLVRVDFPYYFYVRVPDDFTSSHVSLFKTLILEKKCNYGKVFHGDLELERHPILNGHREQGMFIKIFYQNEKGGAGLQRRLNQPIDVSDCQDQFGFVKDFFHFQVYEGQVDLVHRFMVNSRISAGRWFYLTEKKYRLILEPSLRMSWKCVQAEFAVRWDDHAMLFDPKNSGSVEHDPIYVDLLCSIIPSIKVMAVDIEAFAQNRLFPEATNAGDGVFMISSDVAPHNQPKNNKGGVLSSRPCRTETEEDKARQKGEVPIFSFNPFPKLSRESHSLLFDECFPYLKPRTADRLKRLDWIRYERLSAELPAITWEELLNRLESKQSNKPTRHIQSSVSNFSSSLSTTSATPNAGVTITDVTNEGDDDSEGENESNSIPEYRPFLSPTQLDDWSREVVSEDERIESWSEEEKEEMKKAWKQCEWMWLQAREVQILFGLSQLIYVVDPDMIITYNGEGFDWPFLYDTALKLGLLRIKDPNKGRYGGSFDSKFKPTSQPMLTTSVIHGGEKQGDSPAFGQFSRLKNFVCPCVDAFFSSKGKGDNEFCELTSPGRIQLDIMKFIRNEYKLSSYRLEDVSDHFLKQHKLDVDIQEMFNDFDFNNKKGLVRDAAYALKDSNLLLHLLDKLSIVYYIFCQTRETYTNAAEILKGGQQKLVFYNILRECLESDEMVLVPTQSRSYDNDDDHKNDTSEKVDATEEDWEFESDRLHRVSGEDEGDRDSASSSANTSSSTDTGNSLEQTPQSSRRPVQTFFSSKLRKKEQIEKDRVRRSKDKESSVGRANDEAKQDKLFHLLPLNSKWLKEFSKQSHLFQKNEKSAVLGFDFELTVTMGNYPSVSSFSPIGGIDGDSIGCMTPDELQTFMQFPTQDLIQKWKQMAISRANFHVRRCGYPQGRIVPFSILDNRSIIPQSLRMTLSQRLGPVYEQILQTLKKGVLAESKRTTAERTAKGYLGAMVLEPDLGIHLTPTGVMDFSKMYPSIMGEKNLSYETMLTPAIIAQYNYVQCPTPKLVFDARTHSYHLEPSLEEYIKGNLGHYWQEEVEQPDGTFQTRYWFCQYAGISPTTGKPGSSVGILPKLLQRLSDARDNAKRICGGYADQELRCQRSLKFLEQCASLKLYKILMNIAHFEETRRALLQQCPKLDKSSLPSDDEFKEVLSAWKEAHPRQEVELKTEEKKKDKSESFDMEIDTDNGTKTKTTDTWTVEQTSIEIDVKTGITIIRKRVFEVEVNKNTYNQLQLSFKVISNSVYGFMGAKNGMLPCMAIADQVTDEGRRHLAQTILIFKNIYDGSDPERYPKHRIRYGDTDSVMPHWYTCPRLKTLEHHMFEWIVSSKTRLEKDLTLMSRDMSVTKRLFASIEKMVRGFSPAQHHSLVTSESDPVVDLTFMQFCEKTCPNPKLFDNVAGILKDIERVESNELRSKHSGLGNESKVSSSDDMWKRVKELCVQWWDVELFNWLNREHSVEVKIQAAGS